MAYISEIERRFWVQHVRSMSSAVVSIKIECRDPHLRNLIYKSLSILTPYNHQVFASDVVENITFLAQDIFFQEEK